MSLSLLRCLRGAAVALADEVLGTLPAVVTGKPHLDEGEDRFGVRLDTVEEVSFGFV